MFFRARIVITVLFLCALGVGAYALFGRSGESNTYELTRVLRGDIVNEVIVTGRIEPEQKVDLAFSSGGVIAEIFVQEGESVEKGDALARLDTEVLEAQLREAEALLSTEQIKLAELLAGARSEDVAITAAQVEKTTIEKERAQIELVGTMERVLQLSNNTVKTNIDPFYEEAETDPDFGAEVRSGNTTYALTSEREQTLYLERARKELNGRFTDWELALSQQSQGIEVLAKMSEQNLLFIAELAARIGAVLNTQSVTDATVQSFIDSYKANISTARTAVSSLLSELRTAQDAFESKSATLTVARNELTLKGADPTAHATALQYANIDKARASKNRIEAQLKDTRLISPLSGVVAQFSLKEGEVVSGGEVVAVVLAEDAFELIAYIPEADIARVSVGDSAEVILDAYDRDDVLFAEVEKIAQIETTLEGVATYKTTLSFRSPDDARIRAGLTADISILTDEQTGVLYVPSRAVIRTNGRQYVRVVENETLVEKDVVVGLRGTDGMVEIREGLSELDAVVLFIEE